MDRPDRYRGLKANPQALGVTPLAEGELSKPVRVRASVAVHDWLKGFTSTELGQLLEQVYAQQQAHAGAATPTAAPKKPRKPRATATAGATATPTAAVKKPRAAAAKDKSTEQKKTNKPAKSNNTE